MSQNFPRKEKLKHRKRITELFESGHKLTEYPIRLYWLRNDTVRSDSCSRAAVSVPKRRFKKAVDRNHIKRLMRESYRREKEDLFNNTKGTYDLLFLYLGRDIPTQRKLNDCMNQLLTKLSTSEAHEQ